MTQLKEGRHYRVDEWTRRQREVFDLLVKGYTNREIAENLGVSLDGAKWHVSEIITKLGVDSREEAADYWREYNGWPRRLHRMFRTMIGGGVLKWAGGAGVAVGGTGIVAVALFFGLSGDNSAPADTEATPPAEETQEPDDPTPEPTPGEITGLFTEPDATEPDSERGFPSLEPGLPEPQGEAAIFDIEAGETIDLGDGWLPEFNPAGTMAAYVVGEVGPGAAGEAEVRVIHLESRDVETVHTVDGAAVEASWHTGPESGDPVFWWYDNDRLAVYQPVDDEWVTLHVGTGEAGEFAFRYASHDGHEATWQVVDSGSGNVSEQPAEEGLPRNTGEAAPPPVLTSWAGHQPGATGYEIDPPGRTSADVTRAIRDAGTGFVIAELEAYDVVPVDGDTALVFTRPDPSSLLVNLFVLDLVTLEAEFVMSGAFPPSAVSVRGSQVLWSERACGLRNAAAPITHPDHFVAAPGDIYSYDLASGELERVDAAELRGAGATALFAVHVDDGRWGIAYDSHGIHVIVDAETLEPQVVLPLAARNWTADHTFAAVGRVSDRHTRCASSIAGAGQMSRIQALTRAAGIPLFRVTGSETCLNLRAEPSIGADILSCDIDGTPLLEREADEAPDGWIAVRTLDGQDAWASAEFLARVE